MPDFAFDVRSASAILSSPFAILRTRSKTSMTSRYHRFGLALFLLLLMVALIASPSGSDALAQRKGGGGQKDGKAKEKDIPPPNFTMPDSWAKAFHWRCIGPANMGGRITAISVFEADPS